MKYFEVDVVLALAAYVELKTQLKKTSMKKGKSLLRSVTIERVVWTYHTDKQVEVVSDSHLKQDLQKKTTSKYNSAQTKIHSPPDRN